MIDILIALSILFSIFTGFIYLEIKNHRVRGGIVYLTTVVLIVTSVLFLWQGSFPIEYTLPPAWGQVILVCDYIILFSLFVAIRDLATEGNRWLPKEALRKVVIFLNL